LITSFEPKPEQRGEQAKIEREMSSKAPVPVDLADAAAGDVEAAHFCGDGGKDERSPKTRRDLRLSPAECLPQSD
jgi:hypothetical protein